MQSDPLVFTLKPDQEVLPRILQLVDFNVLVCTVELPLRSVEQIYEFIARLPSLLDKLPRFCTLNLRQLLVKVLKGIIRRRCLIDVCTLF